jgi:HD-like signal output (HDOD) protein
MSQEIWAQLQRTAKLATPPRVALEVLRLAGRQDASVAEVAALIEKDTALSARLLKTVNRAYYGVRRQVGSVRQAAALLGLRAVKLVALNFSVFGIHELRSQAGLDYQAHWRRCLAQGMFASRLARRAGFQHTEEAYIAGLLAGLGVQVLYRCMGPQYEKVLAESTLQCFPLFQVERARLGVTHAEVSAWLLGQWHLPEMLCEAIRDHHQRPPEAPGEDTGRLADILYAADLAAGAMEDENAPVSIGTLQRFAEQRFGLDEQAVAECLAQTEREIEETRWLLDLGPIRRAGCGDLLRQAAEYRAKLKASGAPAAAV